MTEIRTTSVTGGLKGVKPERYSFIPKAPLDLLARIYGYGDEKYGDAHNYRKGYEWSKNYDALQRHLTAWWEREDTDPESGLSHLGHAAWHIFALIVFASEERYKQFDDRYRATGVEFDRMSKDEPGLILVTPEEFDNMIPSFLDENTTAEQLESHIQHGRISINQAWAWRQKYQGAEVNICVWQELQTLDHPAWECHTHRWVSLKHPAPDERCGVALTIQTLNTAAVCFYTDPAGREPESDVCLEHNQTSKYGPSEGPHRACQAIDPWVPPRAGDLFGVDKTVPPEVWKG